MVDANIATKITQAMARLLKEVRLEKGLTQHDLQERSGLSLRMISELERGNTQPSLVSFFHLAKGLDVDSKELFARLVKMAEK